MLNFRLMCSLFLLVSLGVQAQELIPDWRSIKVAPFPPEPTDNQIVNPVLRGSDVFDVNGKVAEFVADPFLFRKGNLWFMFFEALISSKGVIGLAESGDGLAWKFKEIILEESFHLSYPQVFSWNGRHYMIPETNEANEIRLYAASEFPRRWGYKKTLISGRDFVDPTLLRYKNRWWIFASDGSCGPLYLYYSDNLMSGWREHPKSPVFVDPSKGRGGGRSFVYNQNQLLRIAQKDDVYYGEAVRIFAVDVLNTEDYREHEVSSSPILSPLSFPGGMWGWESAFHQYDPWWTGSEWIVAVDKHGPPTHNWEIGILKVRTQKFFQGVQQRH